MKRHSPKESAAISSAKRSDHFRHLTRCLALTLLGLCLGLGIGCIAPSPSLFAARQARRWQQAAQQLKTQPPHQFADALLHLPADGRPSLMRLWQNPTDERLNKRAQIIGRALLWAAGSYLDAARLALDEGNLERTLQFCQAAVLCLKDAASFLPPWERASALRWAMQLATLRQRQSDRFYVRTHLLALCVKVKAQAAFVPKAKSSPSQRRSSR
ncbi:MAG: hypothetical protein RJAPGHWK_002903 [Candidatus Fervidibacter sp.]